MHGAKPTLAIVRLGVTIFRSRKVCLIHPHAQLYIPLDFPRVANPWIDIQALDPRLMAEHSPFILLAFRKRDHIRWNGVCSGERHALCFELIANWRRNLALP
jgi:hypothetical protein